jgi:hypothetical protein
MIVIMAVISVLVSMIAPNFVRAREVAKRAVCSSQLASIGKTYIRYQAQGAGFMPVFNWMYGSEMEDVYLCPKDDDPKRMNFLSDSGSVLEGVRTSYGFNLSASEQSIMSVASSSDFVLSFDSSDLFDYWVDREKEKNNNGHGNNVDDVDTSNPGDSKIGEDSEPDVDDENRGTIGDDTSWKEILGGITAADVENWYTQNLNFRHYGYANQLYLDGTVRGVTNASDVEKFLMD